MSKPRPHILSAVEDSIANYNRISGGHVRLVDSPFVGPRMAAQKTIDIGSEFKLHSQQTVSEFDFINGTWVGLHHYGPEGPCDSVHLRDLEVRTSKKWASRSYRMRTGNRVEYCSFVDVLDEHAIYWNLAGGVVKGENALVIANCFFENIGSQAVQLVQRDHEQGFDFTADSIPGAPVYFSDSVLRNVGDGWGDLNRASYAISVFGREKQSADGHSTLAVTSIEQDFHLRRVMLDNSMQVVGHKDGATSHGAIYVGPRPTSSVKECVVLMGKTDRPVARFEGVDDVTIQGSYFHAEGGQARIEFENCGKINVQGCHGNVDIYLKTSVGSVKVSTIETGFSQPARVSP